VFRSPLVALLAASPLLAKLPPPPTPPAVRTAEAQVVLVGEVTKVANVPFAVTEPNGSGGEVTRSYTPADVTVKTPLVGAGKLKTIQVGFSPDAARASKEDGYRLHLTEGEVRCLFLTKHPTADFYVESGVGRPLDPANKEDAATLDLVKKVAAVLAEPAKALKAEAADDRVFAALCLAYNYCPANKDGLTAEDLPKEESDLILKALRDADPAKLERADGLFWVAAVERLGLAKGERLGPWFGQRGKDRSAQRLRLYREWYDKPGEKLRLQYWVAK
jgi:hypothetical protein